MAVSLVPGKPNQGDRDRQLVTSTCWSEIGEAPWLSLAKPAWLNASLEMLLDMCMMSMLYAVCAWEVPDPDHR